MPAAARKRARRSAPASRTSRPAGGTSSSSWVADVLHAIGAPVTPKTTQLLNSWWAQEGGAIHNNASFNWLNTTLGSQFPAINSVGVRAFPDYQTGVHYTALSLEQISPAAVAALRSGNPYGSAQARDGTLAHAIGHWLSSANPATNDSYASRVLGGRYGPAGGASLASSTSAVRSRPTSSGGVGGFFGSLWSGAEGSASSVWKAGLATLEGPWAVLKAFLWLANPRSWLRMVEFVVGLGIMLLSLIGLAVVFAARQPEVEAAAGAARGLPGPVGSAGKALTLAGSGSGGRRRRGRELVVSTSGTQRRKPYGAEEEERQAYDAEERRKARERGRRRSRQRESDEAFRARNPGYDKVPF